MKPKGNKKRKTCGAGAGAGAGSGTGVGLAGGGHPSFWDTKPPVGAAVVDWAALESKDDTAVCKSGFPDMDCNGCKTLEDVKHCPFMCTTETIECLRITMVSHWRIKTLIINRPLKDKWLRAARVPEEAIRQWCGITGLRIDDTSLCILRKKFNHVMRSFLPCFSTAGSFIPTKSRDIKAEDTFLAWVKEHKVELVEEGAFDRNNEAAHALQPRLYFDDDSEPTHVTFVGPWPGTMSGQTIPFPGTWTLESHNSVHLI